MEKARSASFIFFVSGCALAVLAAFGVDALGERQQAHAQLAKRMMRSLAAVGSAFALLVFLGQLWKPSPAVSTDAVMLTAIVALLLAALLAAWSRSALSPGAFVVLLILLALVEWAPPMAAQIHDRATAATDAPLHRDQDIAQFLKSRPEPVRIDVSNSLIPYNFGDWYGIDQRLGYVASAPTRVFDLIVGEPRATPLLAVNYVIAKAPASPDQKEVFTSAAGLKVYKDESAFPRLWTVHGAVEKDSLDESGTPATWRKTATLAPGPLPPLAPCDADDAIEIKRFDADRLEVNTTMACAGVLVLSNAYDAEWNVSVDDRPATLYRAYGALQGAGVPAGKHLVRFRYRPWHVYIGAAVTLLGLLLAGTAARLPEGFWDRCEAIFSE